MVVKQIQLLPQLLQCKPQYDVDPQTGNKPENILWFKSAASGTPSIANLTAIAAAFDPAWANVYKACGSTAYHYNGSIWTDFSNAFGLVYSSVGAFTPVAGAAGGVALPYNVAALLSLKTGEHYRGGHFRVYMPYLGANVIGTNSSIMQPTYVNALGTAFSALNAATTASGVLGGQTQVCYRHRFTSGTARLDVITAFVAQTQLATQRRRLRKAPHH
jgi:hypothetical protein